jgi:amino acid permease
MIGMNDIVTMENKGPYFDGKNAEMGVMDGSTYEEQASISRGDHSIKRDLRRRHINMIAIAGMIVSAGN